MAFKPPSTFDCQSPSAWPEWRQRFSRYKIAAQLDKESDEAHIDILLYAMGAESKKKKKVYSPFQCAEGEDYTKYTVVLGKFHSHFVPKKNVIHERATFRLGWQRDGETVEQYVRALYHLSQYAKFPNREESIRDELVLGLSDKKISEKNKKKNKQKTHTQKKQQQQQLQLQADWPEHCSYTSQIARGSQTASTAASKCFWRSVDAVNRRQHGGGSGPSRYQTTTTTTTTTKEDRGSSCGKCSTAHKKDACPANGKKCYKCDTLSHFARVCRSKPKKVREISADITQNNTQPFFNGSVHAYDEPPRRMDLQEEEQL